MLLGCKQCSACFCLVFSEVLICAFEGCLASVVSSSSQFCPCDGASFTV